MDLHCFQRQGISGVSRTRVNSIYENDFTGILASQIEILTFYGHRAYVYR